MPIERLLNPLLVLWCVLVGSLGVGVPVEAERWPEGFDKSTPIARTLYEAGETVGELVLYRRLLGSYPPGLEDPTRMPEDHPLRHIRPHVFFVAATPRAKLRTGSGTVPWLVYLGSAGVSPGDHTLGEVVWNKYRKRAYVMLATSSSSGTLLVRIYEVDPARKLATFPLAFDPQRAAEWPKPSEPLVEAWRSLRGATSRRTCRVSGGELQIKRLSLLTGEDRVLACGQRDGGCEDIYFAYDLATKEWLDLAVRQTPGAPIFKSMKEFR